MALAGMRFWITKNSELPVREQIVRQVRLGILSEDLPPGHKLPSVRAFAQRYRIHSNTVSAAYHELLERGWLELRRGRGLYVRQIHPDPDQEGDGLNGLHGLLTALLQTARSRGYEPEEVLHRLEHMLRPLKYERVLIAEPDAAMREILGAEIREHVALEVAACENVANVPSRSLVAALPTRASKVRAELPPGVLCVVLRLRSVGKSLEGQTKPGPDTVISIVSKAAEIRQGARAMLIAVGIDPESLRELDSAEEGWRDRLGTRAFVVTDLITAAELPAGCQARVFRIIADSSIAELKALVR
jgi:DNA-binding transcriptional regulator YhcF (GntR family)